MGHDKPLTHPDIRNIPRLSLADRIRYTIINKNTLLASNAGSAQEISRWTERRNAGELFMVYSCSDSRALRIFPGDDSIMYPTIAAVGHDHKEPSRIPHKGKIIATHYPCGGAHGKEYEHLIPESGLKDYIENRIKDANVVRQALIEAEEASKYSDEPVLAVIVDQQNADIIPIAYMQRGKPTLIARDPKTGQLASEFNPGEKHSLKGLPRLAMEDVGVFAEYLQKTQAHAEDLLGNYGDFQKTQESQNPPILVLDTEENPPLSKRFGELLEIPGIAFRISSEGDRNKAKQKHHFQTVLNQAEYPLDNFSNLRITLIQANDSNSAREMAKAFLDRPKGRAWLAKPGTELIVVSGKDGIIDPKSMLVITEPDYFTDRRRYPVFISPTTGAV